ncbi:protein terminal ear1-like [Amborella trichopoda]|nr:protein terminal ear1-like [Amborella trichopoda]|eukprot:XP_020522840.1 protein terminal ear1-like [Amborella trichopoda]
MLPFYDYHPSLTLQPHPQQDCNQFSLPENPTTFYSPFPRHALPHCYYDDFLSRQSQPSVYSDFVSHIPATPLSFPFHERSPLVVDAPPRKARVSGSSKPRNVGLVRESRRERNGLWRPKEKSAENGSDPILIVEELSDAQSTTVMIKNIPNKLSRKMLVDLLENLCKEENEKGGILSEFDFVYLPMDFRSKCNLGYAFVNFTTTRGMKALCSKLHGCHWQMLSSKKICRVAYARLQGKNALVEHFRSSNFPCDSDEYLPLVFTPPSNGLVPSQSTIVGTRVPHLFSSTSLSLAS